MDRRQIALGLTLREMGISPGKMESFDDRLVLQKAIYLVQAAGIDLGYHHGWYLRGPYCSALAEDGFAIASEVRERSEGDPFRGWKLDRHSKQVLQSLASLLSSDESAQKARNAELLASVHFLVEKKRAEKSDPAKIREVLLRYNKNFSEEEITGALNKLEKHGLV